MQAVTATLKHETARREINWASLTETPVSWLTRIFGCWHREMSRPFTLRAESYRVCLECGAHRHFNTQTWEMTGPYFYQSPASLTELYKAATATTSVARVQRSQQQRAFRVAA